MNLPDNAPDAFCTYYKELVSANQVMNLTAIIDEAEAARLHFLDSIALLRAADFKDKCVLDVGTGAGFPGLPLKIVEDSISLTLLDSLQKRIGFLEALCEKLELTNVECIHGRAEELAGVSGDMRESFDIVTSRALARLPVLCELCLPFVKPGGLFIAMKSGGSGEEVQNAITACIVLGGGTPETFEYSVPGTDIVRHAVIVKKITETPVKYPRRFAKIQSSPLE